MRLIAFFLAAFFVSGASAAPRLHLSTPSLAPESVIELVLDRAAAGEETIGRETDNDWLEIKPAWPGKLYWKEANVAEFRPTAAPQLGATYAFTLKKGHLHLDGSEIPPGELAQLPGQPFQVDYAALLDRYTDDWSPRSSAFFLRFNGDVDPAQAAPFLFFRSAGGDQVAAKTERATFARLKQPGYLGASWNERFARRGQAGAPQPELRPDLSLPNGLIVTPQHPLPLGENWQLVLLKGLPEAGGKVTLPADATRYIGNIAPLKIDTLTARSVADQPRSIIADFNLRLPADLPSTLVKIEPTPPDFRAEVRNDELHLLGDFSGENEWHVTLDPAIASHDGRALGAPVSKKLVFQPVPASIGLPSQDESQLAAGSRRYRIQTVNLEKIHLRVKRLNSAQLIRAQQGYRHYTGAGPNGAELKPTHPLPYELIAGEVLADLEISFPNPPDTSQTLRLDWDKLLSGDPQPYELGVPKDETGVTPAPRPPAAFFVEVIGTPKAAARAKQSPIVQSLVQLTDIGLAWKTVDDEARVFAFSCLTGKPLPGVSLTAFGEDAKPLQSAVTGEDGLASLPRDPAARHLQATLGDDRYGIAYDTTLPTVGLWRFPVRYSWGGTPLETRRVFLFTDRSLYRPGETVHLKGIVRRQHGNAIVAQPDAPNRLIVTDPTGREILSREVPIGESGGFDLSFDLPPEKTGYHHIRFEYPEELAKIDETENWIEQNAIAENSRFGIGLRVEEFRRNAFELTHESETPAPGANEVSLLLKASYYQGQPVAKGSVSTYTHISETNFYPEKFRDYLFGDHRSPDYGYWYRYFGYRWDDGYDSRRSDHQSAKTELAEDGTARIAATLPEGEFPTAREVSITTEVTDANRQTLNRSTETLVHPASAYVGVARLDRLVRAGDRIPLSIVAVTPEGEPFPGDLAVEAKLSREINEQTRLSDGNGGSSVRNETRREELSTTPLTLAEGRGTEFLFAPQHSGLHQLELRGSDPEGRPFATAISIHVYGGNEYPWAYEDGTRIKLVPEKKLHQPGDTARVLVLSPIEGTALVTVEREKVLRTFLTELKADNPVLEIPVGDDDAPNAYVSVLVIKGARDSARQFKEPQLRLGYCELMVENRRDRLAVAIDAPAESVLPGREIELTGTVVLPGGQPAANAEVTFYAEDEGTLAVMGYETPNPMAFFYDPRQLRVNCGTTLDKFIAESPDEQTYYNKGFFIGGGGDDLGPLADLPRRDFNPCAGWFPALKADADGKFTATFRLPDTLTRYRLIAVAHHDASRFGHGEAALTVSKPIMIEPQAPRFASEGDRLDIQALVQNASDLSGTWKITFTPNPPASDPIAVLAGEENTQTLTLDPSASATVTFPVAFRNTGEAVLSWRAEPVSLDGTELTPVIVRKHSDQVEARFEVHYPVPLLRQHKLVKLSGGKETDLLANLDPALLAGRGHLELELSRSLLLEAAGSVDYLLTYPYGCLEQTTSSMMPWLAVEQLREVVPAFAKHSPEKIRAALQKGVDRILSMQQENGGFSYWPGNPEYVDWASSYAGLGLILAHEAGAEVPAAALAALCDRLTENLAGLSKVTESYELENACRALWVLALAERQPDAWVNNLRPRLAELTPRARAFLALAADSCESAGDPAEILRSKTPFKGKDDAWMPWNNDRALNLLAWSAIDSSAPETTAALEALVKERNPYGHWRTTWVNAWALLALATYADHEDDAGSATVTLTGPDGPQTLALKPGEPAITLDYPLTDGLALTASTDGSAFVRVRLAAKPEIAPQQPVAKNGLEITRFYERVNPDGTTAPLEKARPGDLVRITLRVDLPADDSRYLVIEDRLPAIFEAINNDFSSQAAHSNAGHTSEHSWNISHRELRSDRAVFFYDRIWRKGRQEITYLARCTMDGQATAPPAKAESMYDPDNVALSASREF